MSVSRACIFTLAVACLAVHFMPGGANDYVAKNNWQRTCKDIWLCAPTPYLLYLNANCSNSKYRTNFVPSDPVELNAHFVYKPADLMTYDEVGYRVPDLMIGQACTDLKLFVDKDARAENRPGCEGFPEHCYISATNCTDKQEGDDVYGLWHDLAPNFGNVFGTLSW